MSFILGYLSSIKYIHEYLAIENDGYKQFSQGLKCKAIGAVLGTGFHDISERTFTFYSQFGNVIKDTVEMS